MSTTEELPPPGNDMGAGTITFHRSGSREAVRYVSDTTVYEEALSDGRLIGLYWSASGQVQRENTTAGLPGLEPLRRPVESFGLEVDGQSLHNRWQWIGATQRAGNPKGTSEAVIELKHGVRPISVKVVTRIDGSPILVRYLEITNNGKAPAAIAAVAPWSGILWNTETERRRHHTNANPSFQEGQSAKYLLGYFASNEPLREGDFVWQPLPQEHLRIERSSHGKAWGSPYYMVKNAVTGELFIIGLAWSGNFYAEFAHRHETLLSFKIGPYATAPQRVLSPGESVSTPEVHMGPMHGPVDEVVGSWYSHMRKSVVPPRPRGKEMYTVGARVVEEPDEWILREIDIAAEMGVEAFMVDAGWYGEKFGSWVDLRGDWQEGSWLPGGLNGVRKYTQEKGLLFGLWQEPETATPKSRLAKSHPEWILRTDGDRQVAEGLDLSVEGAARFLEESVVGVIRDYHLDFYKIDYNISPGEGGQREKAGFAENELWRHYEVLYGVYSRVRKEFPDLCLETCASGGGRNDLGMLSRFHYAAESDWSVMPYSIRAINAMSLFVPPEALCYYHNHVNWAGVQAHHLGDADTHLRVTLFAVPIFVGFGAQDADRTSQLSKASCLCR